jgi:hypothetical protein
MDLRDQLAMRFAAALVDAFQDPEDIARRAYNLAEAMLSERARRLDAEEALAIQLEPRLDPMPRVDEELEPRWLEAPYDPSWDLDPRWGEEPPRTDAEQERPGLARTQANEEALRKERSA